MSGRETIQQYLRKPTVFDKFSRHVEEHRPEFSSEIREAALFVVDHSGLEDLCAEYRARGQADGKLTLWNYLLPFPITAVEIANGVYIRNEESGLFAFARSIRGMLAITWCRLHPDERQDGGVEFNFNPEIMGNDTPEIMGNDTIDLRTGQTSVLRSSDLEDRKYMSRDENTVQHAFVNFAFVISQINAPKNLILEASTDAQLPQPKHRPRTIALSAERTIFTVIDTAAAAKRYVVRAPDVDRRSPRIHLRRRHFKTLRHERYGPRRGDRIVVRESVVGGKLEDVQRGRRRYRVRLDITAGS